MKVEISASLVLMGPPPAMTRSLTSRLTLPNPAFASAVRGGRRTFGIPQTLAFYRQEGDRLILPRGLAGTVLHRLKEAGVPVEGADKRVTAPVDYAPGSLRLRDYQEQAVRRAVVVGSGILTAPTGSGKTIMGAELVRRLGQRALWVVHTQDLAAQAMERLRDGLSLADGDIGLIGAGENRIGERVTVALVQSLQRRDLSALAPLFGTVIVDEAHHTPAATFLEAVQAFPARYRIGLTATPERRDGLGRALSWVFGPVAAEIKTEDLAGEKHVLLPLVRRVPTAFRCDSWGDWPDLLESLTHDEQRNRLIIRHLAREVRAGHQALVLSERIEHLNLLECAFREVMPDERTAVVTGEMPKAQRATAIEEARSRTVRVLFATRLADEGLDIPSLDRLFLTCPTRAAGKVRQQLGRIMRPHPGKGQPVVFEFVDPAVGVLDAQAKARFWEVYRPMNLRVEVAG